MFIIYQTIQAMIFFKRQIVTFEIKIPGSPVPKGTHEWSDPPMILRPKGPPAFTNMTSWSIESEIKIMH